MIDIGPSPRMWGLLFQPGDGPSDPRSIPTHVGFTASSPSWTMTANGPSPRMWGLRRRELEKQIKRRSIPTHVGFTAPEEDEDKR